MRFRRFGPLRRDVPIIGQGTWEIDENRREQTVAALRRGLDEGMTHIDTAEMYGDSELLIAEAISAGDLKLSDRELALIDAAFPRGPKPAVLPTI